MVTYPDFSDVIRICIEIGVSCKLGKSDMRSAFRNLGMRLMDFPSLIMKARIPLDNQWYYFIDKCLPFGSSISCAHFQRFSNSIAFVMKIQTGCKPVNYLDDYLFAALRRLWCNQLIQSFLELCEKVRFPVSLEKTEWAQGIVIFLGLLIDAARQVVCIPINKIVKARELIAEVLQKKKVTIKTLQKVCGYLNFLCRCVVLGRAFTRRLYYFTSNKQTSSNGKVLQGYHHVRVNKEMREDLVMWQTFIAHPSIFCRPFLDFSRVLEAESIRFYMDASGNYSLGMGGICEQSWFCKMWDTKFVSMVKPSIEYLELFAVIAGILFWIKRFQNCRIVLYCDNISVVYMLNKSTSSCMNCMALIRLITLECLLQNMRIYAKYV